MKYWGLCVHMGSRMGDCCFESLMVADKILVCILVKLERAKKGFKCNRNLHSLGLEDLLVATMTSLMFTVT